MVGAKVKFTYGDYLQLPEDKRYELMEREFHSVPSLNVYHQTIAERDIGLKRKLYAKYGVQEY